MGTSLTGLTPSTTYDALIKVGDNGPLSATAKYLSDGLGNDSPISMSTTLVGIGTNTPYTSLTIGNTDATAEISSGGANTHLTLKTVGASGALRFFTIGGGTNTLATTESMRITSIGNVGIGTSSPTQKLHVVGAIINSTDVGGTGDSGINIISGQRLGFDESGVRSWNLKATGGNLAVTSGDLNGEVFMSNVLGVSQGIKFPSSQFSSSNANTLDDYEEGTWDPTILGTTGDGTATYSFRQARYTKIGRLVFIDLDLSWNSFTGTGDLQVGNLPFTAAAVPGGNMNYSSTNVTLSANNYNGLAQVGDSSGTRIGLYQSVVGGGAITRVAVDSGGGIWLNGFYIAA